MAISSSIILAVTTTRPTQQRCNLGSVWELKQMTMALWRLVFCKLWQAPCQHLYQEAQDMTTTKLWWSPLMRCWQWSGGLLGFKLKRIYSVLACIGICSSKMRSLQCLTLLLQDIFWNKVVRAETLSEERWKWTKSGCMHRLPHDSAGFCSFTLRFPFSAISFEDWLFLRFSFIFCSKLQLGCIGCNANAHLYLHSFQFPVQTGYQEERHGRFGEVSGIRIFSNFIHCSVSVVFCCSFLIGPGSWFVLDGRECSSIVVLGIGRMRSSWPRSPRPRLKFQKSWQVLPAPEISLTNKRP